MRMDSITQAGGRTRALRLYRKIGRCENCGQAGRDRHHLDGDATNNEPSNVMILCRRCHMVADGRMIDFIELAKQNQPHATAMRWGNGNG